jgi:hypothetical protein
LPGAKILPQRKRPFMRAAKAERVAEGDKIETVVAQFIERYAKTKTRD